MQNAGLLKPGLILRTSPTTQLVGRISTVRNKNSMPRNIVPTQMRTLNSSHTLSSDNNKSSKPAGSPFVLDQNPDFDKVEAAREPFQSQLPVVTTQAPGLQWKYGGGANATEPPASNHVEIDPATRPFIANYKLLISAIPRPISFVSTVGKDGTKNLSPFSYFQVVDHDPPIFVIGFSGRAARPKDTRRNLLETGECVISVVGENIIQGINATSLDVPYGTSEWALSGFTPKPASTVKPERVEEAVFSVEGKLLEMKELNYGDHGASVTEDGKPHGALAIIQGTRFWVRRDAVNEKGDSVDLSVMRPLVQLGGISYGRVRETFELPRGSVPSEMEKKEKGLAKVLSTQQKQDDRA